MPIDCPNFATNQVYHTNWRIAFSRRIALAPVRMSRTPIVILLIVLIAIVGGFAFLATWDIPPPSAQVEHVIPNDRFPK